jgi:hypothetical protein
VGETDAAPGTAVGETDAAPGVAVAEDPQANNRAKISRTIALGQCLTIFMLDPDLVIVITPIDTKCS